MRKPLPARRVKGNSSCDALLKGDVLVDYRLRMCIVQNDVGDCHDLRGKEVPAALDPVYFLFFFLSASRCLRL